jgi:hypothetical protein
MSRPLSPFEVLAAQSHAELLEEAVQIRLQQSDLLSEIVGDRIYIVSDPQTRPEEPLPLITIATPSESRDFELNSEAEVTIPLGICLWYSETRYYRERGERSVKALVNFLISLLMDDQRLDKAPLGEGNEYGLPPVLAESIRRIETVDYGAVATELDEDGGFISADLFRVIVFQYAYGVHQISGVIQ